MPANVRSHRTLRRAAVGALALAGLTLVGCANNYRGNPTPELATLSNTDPEVANATTITFDTNLRALWDDLARATLVDRPSMLMRPRMPH